tara:strand:- start:445 stop:1011 length:567 start_codon:yes stop_codon:yes gene_type:complete
MNARGKGFYRSMWGRHGATLKGMGWKDAIDCHIPYERGHAHFGPGSVLDVGCGIGMGWPSLTKCQVYGCDTHRPVIRWNQQLMKLSRYHFWVGDHRSVRGAFDWAVMGGIFNVGYTWERVVEVVRHTFDMAVKGVSIGFGTGTETIGSVKASTFEPLDWLMLGTELGSPDIRQETDDTCTIIIERRPY